MYLNLNPGNVSAMNLTERSEPDSPSNIARAKEPHIYLPDRIQNIAINILKVLFSNRRLLPSPENGDSDFNEEAKPHLDNLVQTVARYEPITLILPGFPAKSPNRNKTLGPLPDLAEKHALQNLLTLCRNIQQVYSPGAKIVICSDGRVFSDLVRIPDKDVSNYGKYLKDYALAQYPDCFEFFNLDEVYPTIKDFDVMREELLIHHGESISALRLRCKTDRTAEAMYKGITRFIFEDYSGLDEFNGLSRSAIQKKSRIIAYRVIQRSNAWTNLLAQQFPYGTRLSIHPQYRVSSKIGVYLAETDDCWRTPWHAVAVRENGAITLMKRSEAEKKAFLAYENGLPSHFEIINSR